MDIVKSEYVKPAPARKPGKPAEAKPEVIAAIKPFIDEGIDTLFDVNTETDKVKSDTLAVQLAARTLGVSARVKDVTEHGDGNSTIVFQVRPARKKHETPDAGEALDSVSSNGDLPAEV